MVKAIKKDICRGHALGIASVTMILALLLSGAASGVTPVSSCGTISSPGEYVINSSLTSSTTCISITSSDVIFDGAYYTITGEGSDTGVSVYKPGVTISNVTIEHLNVINWGTGIYFQNVLNGDIDNNNASNNDNYGIELKDSSGNTIYNNIFNNINNFFETGSLNTWNITRTSGTNMVSGPYLGGNFWANPGGTGFSQTCRDSNNDGICDSSYALDGSNIDHLPLHGPFAYVANSGDNTVSVIDTITNTVTATVPVGSYPHGVAVNPAGTRVYVANEDPSSNYMNVNVIVSYDCAIMYPFRDCNNFVMAKSYPMPNGTVSVIDTATNNVIATVPVGIEPYGVAVNPVGTKVYVVTEGYYNSGYAYAYPTYMFEEYQRYNTVSVIDTATNTVTATVRLENLPLSYREDYTYRDSDVIAVNPDGTKVYVTTAGSWLTRQGNCGINPAPVDCWGYLFNLYIIDAASNTITATVDLENKLPSGIAVNLPYGVAVNPTGTKVYVTDQSPNVSVIDTTTNTITATVPVISRSLGIAVNPAGTRVYVANPSNGVSQVVSVIDTTTNTVTATVPVGEGANPLGVAVNPAGTKVYVTNYGISGYVSVIDTATNTVTAMVPVGKYPDGIAIRPVISAPTPKPTPTIKDIRIEGIVDAKNPETVNGVRYTAVLSDNTGATVNWVVEPIGSRITQTNTAGKPKIANRAKVNQNPWLDHPPRDTHGEKRVTAKVTWTKDGKTYHAEKQKNYNLFFRKQSQDFGAGDPPCTGYRNAARGDLTNCDNWFRYWSSSDDSANMHNRTNAAPTEWIYRGGDYNGDQFGASSPWGDFGGATFPYVALYNSASMSCAFNIILPPGGPAQINFNNKGNGTDCVEDTIGHELGHVLIKRLWNTPQAAGGWQGLTDTDNDRIPDGIENGSLLYNGLNYSTLGFNPNNANSIPGFPYGNDEEVFGEIQGWGRTGTHANDWANPGKQSNPPYKRIIVENGTDATLNGTYVDYAIDTNSNGLFDYLIIGVWVNVLDPGTYTVFGNIYNNGNMLWAKNFTYLQPGMQLVLLKFDGLLIRKYRTVGTFNLTDITIFNKNSVDEDTSLNKSVYTTSFYNYTQFEKPAAGYTGSFSDHGVDVNGNGLYDYLIVTTWIDVAESGNYTIEGNIESKSKTVATSQNNSYLMPGIHAIDLVFDGSEIRTHRKNGSYTLGLLRAMNNSYDELDVLYNYYNTSTYTYTQFEKTKAEFTGSFTDFGVDTDGDGLYNYLSLNAEVDTDSSGVYSISAHLLDSNSTEITWNSSTVNLTAGIQIISLNFDGISISNHKVDGHYMVSALDLEDEEGSAVSHVLDSFKTSAYNYIQFEPTPATSTGAITRRISPSLIQPGSTLNITLTPSPSSLFVSPGYHVIETIPQGFTFAGTSGGYSNQGNVYTFDRMGSDPFVYTLTAPHANGSYTISGTFMDDNGNMGTISGTTTIRVGGIYYDLNGDGRIERSEAIQAVTDYFSGIITRQDAINVVMAYFIG